jgi:hypothetical protein
MRSFSGDYPLAFMTSKLEAGIGSSKAQHGPMIVPSQRQTRVRRLVGGQIGRLAPVEVLA